MSYEMNKTDVISAWDAWETVMWILQSPRERLIWLLFVSFLRSVTLPNGPLFAVFRTDIRGLNESTHESTVRKEASSREPRVPLVIVTELVLFLGCSWHF